MDQTTSGQQPAKGKWLARISGAAAVAVLMAVPVFAVASWGMSRFAVGASETTSDETVSANAFALDAPTETLLTLRARDKEGEQGTARQLPRMGQEETLVLDDWAYTGAFRVCGHRLILLGSQCCWCCSLNKWHSRCHMECCRCDPCCDRHHHRPSHCR